MTEKDHLPFFKLADFGMSKLNSENIEPHESWAFYNRAPELIRPLEPHAPKPPAPSYPGDWYSFGFLLHTLATGRSPFDYDIVKKRAGLEAGMLPLSDSRLTDMIVKLLIVKVELRLGSKGQSGGSEAGFEEIEKHSYFGCINTYTNQLRNGWQILRSGDPLEIREMCGKKTSHINNDNEMVEESCCDTQWANKS